MRFPRFLTALGLTAAVAACAAQPAIAGRYGGGFRSSYSSYRSYSRPVVVNHYHGGGYGGGSGFMTGMLMGHMMSRPAYQQPIYAAPPPVVADVSGQPVAVAQPTYAQPTYGRWSTGDTIMAVVVVVILLAVFMALILAFAGIASGSRSGGYYDDGDDGFVEGMLTAAVIDSILDD